MLVFRKDMKSHTNNLRAIVRNRNLRAVLFLLAIAITVDAQSGRRSSNGQTTAPSVSGAKTVEKAAVKAPKIQLLVSVEDRNPLMSVPYYLSDTVLDNCVRRLNDASEINAITAGRRMTAAGAINKSKDRKKTNLNFLHNANQTPPHPTQTRKPPEH